MALGGHGVGGEVRQSGAEDDDAALFHVADGAARNVRLGDLAHGDGALHTGFDAGLFREVLEGEAVHDRAEHAHVVGAGTVHAALGQFGAAEEVPPPTTIATSTSGTAAAICLATPRTVSGSTPSFPPPKTSPESFNRTRRRLFFGWAEVVTVSMVPSRW